MGRQHPCSRVLLRRKSRIDLRHFPNDPRHRLVDGEVVGRDDNEAVVRCCRRQGGVLEVHSVHVVAKLSVSRATLSWSNRWCAASISHGFTWPTSSASI